MHTTIAEFSVVQVGLFAHLSGLLGHTSHFLAYLLALLYLGQDDVGYVRVLVQEVVHLLLYEVAYELVYADTTLGGCCLRTQFHLCLALEHGFLYIYAYGSHQAVAYVSIFISLARIILDDLGNVFFEGCLMCTAQSGMLAVYEGIVFLAVLLGVRECYLYVLATKVADGVERLVIHTVVEKVGKTIARVDTPTVEHDGEPGVQVGVVAQHYLYELVAELVVFE